jgi:hypothetical protein
MPGSTVPFGLPYPLPTDPTSAQAIEDLAKAADTQVGVVAAQVEAARTYPSVYVTGGVQPTASGVLTQMVFNAEVFDEGNMADLIAFPNSIVIPEAGGYVVIGQAGLASNTAGDRHVEIRANGVTIDYVNSPTVTAAGFPYQEQIGVITLYAPGDRLSLHVRQNSGTSLNVAQCFLAAWKITN